MNNKNKSLHFSSNPSTMTMVESQSHPSHVSTMSWNPSTLSSFNGLSADLSTFEPPSSKWSSLNSNPLNSAMNLNLNLNPSFIARNPISNTSSPQWHQFQTLQRAVQNSSNFMNPSTMMQPPSQQQQQQQQQHLNQQPNQSYPRPPQQNFSRFPMPQPPSYSNPASNQFGSDQMKDLRLPIDFNQVPPTTFPNFQQNLFQPPNLQDYLNTHMNNSTVNLNSSAQTMSNGNNPTNTASNGTTRETDQMLAAFEYAKHHQNQLWKYNSQNSASNAPRPFLPGGDSMPAFDINSVQNIPRFDQLGFPNMNSLQSSLQTGMSNTSPAINNYPQLSRMHPSLNPLANPLFPPMSLFNQMPALQGISNIGSLTSFAQNSPVTNAIIGDTLEEQMYPCTHGGCTQILKSRFALKRHMKKHTGEKPHSCPFKGCHRKFSETTALKRHTRTHTGEKPYRCSFPNCTKTFADATNVKRHEMTHTGEKPFKCNFQGCGRCFSRRSSLRTHMSSLHNIRLEDMPPDPQDLH